ncbi:hypothetical protein [Streptomyces sp. NPDC002540]
MEQVREGFGVPMGVADPARELARRLQLRMWAIDGTWERVFTVLVAQVDAEDDL